jgi:hypothetical protein
MAVTGSPDRARTDPEDPLAIPSAPIVEWHRIDAGARIRRVLLSACALMAVGSLTVVTLIFARTRHLEPLRAALAAISIEGEGIEVLLGLLGLGFVIGGGLTAVVGLHRLLAEESWIALRVDGALFVHGESRRFASWDDVEDVRFDAQRDAVVIVIDGGEEWAIAERFAGTANRDLAKSAAAIRRKARFGLYRA